MQVENMDDDDIPDERKEMFRYLRNEVLSLRRRKYVEKFVEELDFGIFLIENISREVEVPAERRRRTSCRSHGCSGPVFHPARWISRRKALENSQEWKNKTVKLWIWASRAVYVRKNLSPKTSH